MKSKRETFIASALAVALVGGRFAVGHESLRLTAWADGRANNAAAVSPSQPGSLPSFADLAARVSPAMVNIKATSMAKADFPDQLFGENFPFPGFRMPCPSNPNS